MARQHGWKKYKLFSNVYSLNSLLSFHFHSDFESRNRKLLYSLAYTLSSSCARSTHWCRTVYTIHGGIEVYVEVDVLIDSMLACVHTSFFAVVVVVSSFSCQWEIRRREWFSMKREEENKYPTKIRSLCVNVFVCCDVMWCAVCSWMKCDLYNRRTKPLWYDNFHHTITITNVCYMLQTWTNVNGWQNRNSNSTKQKMWMKENTESRTTRE